MPTKAIRRYKKTLMVNLSREEVEARSRELCEQLTKMDIMTEEKKAHASMMKERIDGVKEKVDNLRRAVLHKQEERPVQVVEEYDIDNGMVYVRREDTFEAVEKRKASAEEKQMELFEAEEVETYPDDETEKTKGEDEGDSNDE